MAMADGGWVGVELLWGGGGAGGGGGGGRGAVGLQGGERGEVEGGLQGGEVGSCRWYGSWQEFRGDGEGPAGGVVEGGAKGGGVGSAGRVQRGGEGCRGDVEVHGELTGDRLQRGWRAS